MIDYDLCYGPHLRFNVSETVLSKLFLNIAMMLKRYYC
jgi:hypothetical protein